MLIESFIYEIPAIDASENINEEDGTGSIFRKHQVFFFFLIIFRELQSCVGVTVNEQGRGEGMSRGWSKFRGKKNVCLWW